MQADFWLERWEQKQIGFHEEEINSHLQNFWRKLKLPANSKIFVPLCGKSKDILWLLAQGYQVLAVELSPIAVEEFFTENHLEAQITEHKEFQCWKSENLTIYQGDFFNLNSNDLADCTAVYDRASMIALPAEMRQKYLQHLKKIVPALSRTLLITLEYDQNVMQGPPFSISENEVQQSFGENSQIERLFSEDIIDKNEQFKKRGLTSLTETAYSISHC